MPAEETAPGDPLDGIIADYLESADAGRVPSRRDLLDAHPEHADALLAFFADYDRLDNQAEAIRLTARPPAQRPSVRYFGDYELLEEIAEGGMGLVYKARQSTLGRVVALKLVRAGRLAKPIDVARFRVEAEAAAGLDHPNIVPLYEVGEHEGQHYLAMKYIDGPSLAKLPRGDVKTEVARLEAVARAVDFAHRQGILHRDIKPSNILTDAGGTPFVTDFGLAKRMDAELSLTESGQMLGTAGYIAPEQALGKKGLTVTADVFSLGTVLYERLTGQAAFPGGTILERLRSLHDGATPRPTVAAPGLPRDLETVTLKCLEREPGKRYATAGALAEDLGRWLRGEAIVARRVGTAERFWLWCRRNPAVATLAATTTAAMLAGIGVPIAYAIMLKQQTRQAIEAQWQAEHNQLDSILRPIGYSADKIDPAELLAIVDLAQLSGDGLRLRFVEMALSDPDSALRVASRAERVLQAVVGASERRRQLVLNLTSKRQRETYADIRQRVAASWLATALGVFDAAPTLPLGNARFAQGQERGIRATEYTGWLNHSQALELVRGVCEDGREPLTPELVEWLAGVSPTLDAESANDLSDLLAEQADRTDDGRMLAAIGLAMVGLAPRLDTSSAIHPFSALTKILQKVTDREVIAALNAGQYALWHALKIDEAVPPPPPSSSAVALMPSELFLGATFEALLKALSSAPASSRAKATSARIAAMAPSLDSDSAARAWSVLVARAESGQTESFGVFGSGALLALASRLDSDAASRGALAMLRIMERGSHMTIMDEAHRVITSLAARPDVDLPVSLHVMAGKAVIAGLRSMRERERQKESWTELNFVIDQFAPVIEESISTGELSCKCIGHSSYWFTMNPALISSIGRINSLADCLRHPACVGHIRQQVLHRLEQLAFPPPPDQQANAVATSVAVGLTQPLASGLLAAGREAKWRKERKFRTIWDAVAWLRVHHPEIDLDKPYTPRR